MHYFAGRAEQLDYFRGMLGRAGRGNANSGVWEYYGAPGIGKTALIQQECRVAQEMGAKTSYVDFTDPANDSGRLEIEPMGILGVVLANMGIGSRAFETEYQYYLATPHPDGGIVTGYEALDQEHRLYRQPEWLTRMRQVVVEFIKAVNTAGVPTVMFFDNAQTARIPLVDFLEEWVMNPCGQVRSNMTVYADRRPWRWKRPEVRRQLTSVEVKPLAYDELLAWLVAEKGQDSASALVGQIYQATGGHPGAIQAVINNI